jgi:hypothetical protein
MNSQKRWEIASAVQKRFSLVDPYLTEQSRRMWAAAEAVTIGPHGQAIVAEATGISRTTITKARGELVLGSDHPSSRQRQPGGRRKPLFETDPTLLEDLD